MSDAIQDAWDRLERIKDVVNYCHKRAEHHVGFPLRPNDHRVLAMIEICLEDIERDGIRPSEWLAQRTGEKA